MSMTSMSVILAVLRSNIYSYFIYISNNDNVHDVNVSHSGRSYINISIPGIYLTTIMSMTSMSVILAVLTSNINHRGLKGVQVPSCLRSLLTIMSKVMCMRLVFIKHKANNTVYQGMNPHARNPYHYISTTVSSGDSGCLTEYENGDANTQKMRHNSTHMNRQPSQKHDINQDVQLILQKLDLVLSKEEEKEHSELLIKQWVEVAEIIDRFFFWIFVIGTLFTSFFLLLVYPLFKGEAQIIQPST